MKRCGVEIALLSYGLPGAHREKKKLSILHIAVNFV